jgi:hypothetical protein
MKLKLSKSNPSVLPANNEASASNGQIDGLDLRHQVQE